jgi:hypothetical protein
MEWDLFKVKIYSKMMGDVCMDTTWSRVACPASYQVGRTYGYVLFASMRGCWVLAGTAQCANVMSWNRAKTIFTSKFFKTSTANLYSSPFRKIVAHKLKAPNYELLSQLLKSCLFSPKYNFVCASSKWIWRQWERSFPPPVFRSGNKITIPFSTGGNGNYNQRRNNRA